MKNRTIFNWLIIFLGVIAIVGYGFSPAFAGDEANSRLTGIQSDDDSMSATPLEDPEISDDSFGQYYQYTWVPAAAFTPDGTGVFYQYGGYKYRSSGTGYALAPVNLPSGAYLSAAQLFYYDSTSSAWVTGYLYRHYYTSGYQSLGSCTSGSSGFGYCTFYPYHTIRNGDSVYQVLIYTNSTNSSVRFLGARLYWKRQMRTGLPHPFNDIGGLTSEFRNAIAALYNSGITTGTTPTTYSPYANLTRGQMAVFLARALGLYWAYPY